MTLLTDLFVASPEDAPHYETLSDGGDVPPERFQRLQFTGLTSLEFETLWAAARDEERDADQHALTLIEEAQDGTTWLFRFPDAFVALLAQLEPRARQPLAAKWAQAEEMIATPKEVEPVVEGLVQLATSARKSGRGLFLWGSM